MKRKREQRCGNAFLPPTTVRPSNFLGNCSTLPRLIQYVALEKTSSPTTRRMTISANSLEDSKRKSKNQYDNIPDLHQQYLAELNYIERKYGPKRLKKDAVKEAQKSILRAERRARPTDTTQTREPPDGSESETDLSQYETIRNELIGNTLFLGALGLCGVWGFGTIKDVQSFAIGLLGSVAYVVLLSRSVDRLAEGAKESGMQGFDTLQPARIGILIFLVLASAKNTERISILPVLFGFFTYKLATLLPILTGEAFE